jgi:hypothetical protein
MWCDQVKLNQNHFSFILGIRIWIYHYTPMSAADGSEINRIMKLGSSKDLASRCKSYRTNGQSGYEVLSPSNAGASQPALLFVARMIGLIVEVK